MCLGIPGQIQEIRDAELLRMGTVDFGGVSREVCLSYVPEAEVGDYVIVHVGFAISKIDEESAQESLKLFRELGVLEEELGVEPREPSADACYVQPAGTEPGSPE